MKTRGWEGSKDVRGDGCARSAPDLGRTVLNIALPSLPSVRSSHAQAVLGKQGKVLAM